VPPFDTVNCSFSVFAVFFKKNRALIV